MKRFAPACFAAITMGSNASRLIDVESFSSSSKLASLEMHARLITASTPLSASDNFPGVPDVAPDYLEVRVVLRQEVLPEVHDVVHGDLVAQVEQLRGQQAADVPCAAGD